jgi:DNA-binding transcriptional ArsR family regulator
MIKINKDLSNIARLIADQTRASILLTLMDGRALPAGELAHHANVSAQTASNHLSQLMEGHLISCEIAGRHRYYKIASPHIATVLESLGLLTNSHSPSPQRKLDPELSYARSCYDHLAGQLGVQITSQLLAKNYIELEEAEFSITSQGHSFFKYLNIDTELLLQSRRQFAKPCLDWTERKYHLAGALGAALLCHLLNNKLVARSKQKNRVLILNQKGKSWLDKIFGVNSYRE